VQSPVHLWLGRRNILEPQPSPHLHKSSNWRLNRWRDITLTCHLRLVYEKRGRQINWRLFGKTSMKLRSCGPNYNLRIKWKLKRQPHFQSREAFLSFWINNRNNSRRVRKLWLWRFSSWERAIIWCLFGAVWGFLQWTKENHQCPKNPQRRCRCCCWQWQNYHCLWNRSSLLNKEDTTVDLQRTSETGVSRQICPS